MNLSSKRYGFPAPQTIPPQVLATMKVKDNVAYATFPKELRGTRNMANLVATKQQTRFRSDKSRASKVNTKHSFQSDVRRLIGYVRQKATVTFSTLPVISRKDIVRSKSSTPNLVSKILTLGTIFAYEYFHLRLI
jgi:hypothetical protein